MLSPPQYQLLPLLHDKIDKKQRTFHFFMMIIIIFLLHLFTINSYTHAALTPISNITINEDSISNPINFTFTDATGGNYTAICQSSNLTIVDNDGFNIAGSHSHTYTFTTGANVPRHLTLTIKPEPNQSGATNITVTVLKPGGYDNQVFTLTILSVDDQPDIFNLSSCKVIDGGMYHSIALRADGTVLTWGRNYQGQLGDGTTSNRLTPVLVKDLTDVIAVASGEQHNIAIKADGSVWAWGYNNHGQLGDGTNITRLTPVCIDMDSGCIAIACGRYHSMALLDDGTVWTWGYNYTGQLGNDTTEDSCHPIQVSGLRDITFIACGDSHSFAVKNTGKLFAWGSNGQGRLGDGSTDDRYLPIEIIGITNIIAIDGGNSHSIALKANGNVWTWGNNSNGQLGNGNTQLSKIPIEVPGLSNVQSIAAGYEHCMVILNDRTVKTWGAKDKGQLGIGSTGSYVSTPTLISGLNHSKAIATGDKFSLVMTNQGNLFTFGYNYYGQLGNNSSGNGQDKNTPTKVHGMYNIDFLNLNIIAKETSQIILYYQISDSDGDDVTISMESSNEILIPSSNIQISQGDSDSFTFSTASSAVSSITAILTPESGLSGFVSITVSISDNTSNQSHILSYTVGNAPEITSNLYNQFTKANSSLDPIDVTLSDSDTSISDIVFLGTSSNTALINSVTTNGTGATRDITLSPQTNQQGDTTIEVCAYDGNLNSCTSFLVTVTPEYQWQNPLPQTNIINDIWGLADNNILVASQFGMILNYNTISWTFMTTNTSEHINAIWGLSEDVIFATGNNGRILQYDGSKWSVSTNGSNNFNDIWGTAQNNVFAVCDNGAIYKYDGNSWSQVVWDSYHYYGIWGYDENTIYAVGANGTIKNYDGSSWYPRTSGTSDILYSVWGTTASNIYAVGENGTILHYDGSNWSDQTSGTSSDLYHIWGSGASDIFAVGKSGIVLQSDGSSWSEITDVTSSDLSAVWGYGGNVFIGGEDGRFMSYDRSSWTDHLEGIGKTFSDISGISSTSIYAAGKNGRIARYTNGNWIEDVSNTTESLNGIWMNSETDIFAVGNSGTIVHYNGSDWSEMTSNTSQTLNDIHGTSGSNVYAVGASGTILNYTSSEWSGISSTTSQTLNAIWCASYTSIYAVGDNGTIVHFNGSSWSSMSSTTSDHLYAIHGLSDSDIYAVGKSGRIVHYNGSSWTASTQGTEDLHSVVCLSSNHVYVAGDAGKIYFYNGAAWSERFSGYDESLYGIWGSNTEDIFFVGKSGTILHEAYDLYLSIPENASETDGLVSDECYVSLSSGYPDPITISLLSDSPGVLTVPTSVVMPAWVTSVAFDATLIDNATINGTRYVKISAFAPGLHNDEFYIQVLDDDTTTLSINLPASVNEDDGILESIANVVIDSPASNDIRVDLESDDTCLIQVPAYVIIPSGLTSTTFHLDVINNFHIGGDGSLFISAYINGDLNTASDSITFIDDDTKTLSMTLSSAVYEGDGTLSDVGTIRIPGTYEEDVIITLTSSDSSGITGLSEITLYAWTTFQNFDISVVDDAIKDATQKVYITASAPGWTSVSETIWVYDNEIKWDFQSPIPQVNNLLAVWKNHDADIFGVGQNGTIVHYDGSTWSTMISSTSAHLNDIWGSANDNVFAVGDNGTIVYYDGLSWSEMDSEKTVGLYGIWGDSNQDIFVVGGGWNGASNEGTILHYTGTCWVNRDSGTTTRFRDVWGTSNSDVYAVGDSGLIFQYDGSNWSQMTSNTSSYLKGVWGTSNTDIYAVGNSGVIVHYNGQTWTVLSSVTSDTLYDIWGAPGILIAVGGAYRGSSEKATIVTYDGVEWAEELSNYPLLKGVSGVDSNNMWAAGSYGTILNYQNNQWSDIGIPTNDTLNDIWQAAQNEFFAVGNNGAIVHYLNSEWSAMDSPTDYHLYGIWGNSPNDVYAVGGDSSFSVILHYDGSGWTQMDVASMESLKGVWGVAANDIYAVGNSGTILHYAGSGWDVITDTNAEFNDVWGIASDNFYAVGGMSMSGRIYHYDGSSWSLVESLDSGLKSVWGSSANDIYVAGSSSGSPFMYHYNGNGWSETDIGSSGELYHVTGNGPNRIYSTTSNGLIYYYNGTSWRQIKTGASTSIGIYGLICTNSNHIYAVGSCGTILHSKPSLILSIPSQTNENSGTLSNQGLVGIEDPLNSDLTINLSSNNTGKMEPDATVVIPAGETTIRFNLTIHDNALKDGTKDVTLTATANGYSESTAMISVHDSETYTLTVNMPASVTEGDGMIIGQANVSIPAAAEDDIIVSLSSSDTSEIVVPSTVTIPLGQTNKTFDYTVVEDKIVDGNQTADISASISGWTEGSDSITVVDLNDQAISISLPDQGIEGDGVLSEKGVVSIPSVQNSDLTITITNGSSELAITSTVVIQKGWLSAGFPIEILDNASIDGTSSALISVSASGWTGVSDTMNIMDNEKGVFQFYTDLFTTTENAGTKTITVTRTYTITEAASVDYSISDGTAVSGSDYLPVSGTLNFGSGVSSQAFTITILDDSDDEGMETIILTLSNPSSGSSLGTPNPATLSICEVNYFTEQFDANDFDLSNTTFIFTPDGSESYYKITQIPASSFPVDPSGGTSISIGNYSYQEVNILNNEHVYFYGMGYSSFYVADNGYINFVNGNSSSTQTLSDFFSRRRIAPLYADLNPAGSGISWKQLDDRVVVTNENVPDGSSTGANSFQIEMLFNGNIRITYLNIDITDCITGFSKGGGEPSGFYELDYSDVSNAILISGIEDQSTIEDVSIDSVSFSITDADSNPCSHTLTFETSNSEIIPANQISSVCQDDAYTLTIPLVPNQSGSAIITITIENQTLNSSSESFEISVTPVNDPPQVSQVISVASGSGFHLALKANGTVYAWGLNSNGQLGIGSTTEQHTPVPVRGLTNVKAVFAGKNHSMALKNDGTLWAWGANGNGQLGDNSTTDRHVPVQVSGINSVDDVSLGSFHSLAIKRDRTLWAWGQDSYGRLGITPGADQLVPAQVKGVGGSGFLTDVIKVATADNHSMALCSNGDVYIWGHNGNGKLGIGPSGDQNYPVHIAQLSNVKDIGLGNFHSVVLKQDRTVWSWGKKQWLGVGNITTDQNRPVQVLGEGGNGYLTNVIDIVVGEEHTLAIKSDDTVWGFGRNGAGRMGDGTASDRYTPVQVEDNDGTTKLSNILSFDAGTNNSIFVKPDGTIWVCGNNSNGRVGDNTTTERRNITQVLGWLSIGNFQANVVNDNASTRSVHLTLSDAEGNDVTLVATSSDNAILPYTCIELCNSDTNACMLTTTSLRSSNIPIEITTTTLSGMITITINATDSEGLTSNFSFPLTINSSPTIIGLNNLSIDMNGSESISLTVSDNETSTLELTKESSDISLVSLANIDISGTGATRTLTITPTTNQSGTATITINVIDGDIRVSESFNITVIALPPFELDDSISLTGIQNGAVATGDYDNDGDQDIIISGYSEGSVRVTKAYKNTGGGFIEDTGITLPGVDESSVVFGDYDNDDDLDILITGWTSGSRVAKIYQNTGGNFSEYTQINLMGVNSSSSTFGDYDNDGDLDILISGMSMAGRIAKVYQNIDGDFTEDTTIKLIGVENGSTRFGDYDNDGDLDILLTGSTAGSIRISKLYKNLGGSFTEDTSVNLAGVQQGSANFGDYDNDGDLDILLTGLTGGKITKVYENTNGSFAENTGINLDDIWQSDSAFGDYDNDGDLDILISGTNSSNERISKLYENQGGNFIEDTSISLTGTENSAVAFFDYDNDDDIDILITGYTGSEYIANIYRNNTTAGNTAPTSPTSLSASVSGQRVNLSWAASSDSETITSSGLSYKLRIGSSPGACDILSSMSLPLSMGYNQVSSRGLIQTLTASVDFSYTGTYYWQVQSIDTSFKGSPFSNEYSFTIADIAPIPGNNGQLTTDTLLPTASNITLNWQAASDAVSISTSLEYRVYKSSIDLGAHSKVWEQNATALSAWMSNTNTYTSTINETNYFYIAVLVRDSSGNSGIYGPVSLNVFTEMDNISFVNVGLSSTAFGDYDMDGDLDVVVSGDRRIDRTAKIYQNINGSFTETAINITGLYKSAMAFGDYDNDGDPDFVITGDTGGGKVSKVYENTGGDFVEDTGISLENVRDSSVDFGDYDNDGDLDILLTGDTGSSKISKIYKNTNGSFEEYTNANLEGVFTGDAVFGDYDNDGDLDILLTGDTGSSKIAKVYENINGVFVEDSGIVLPQVYSSSVDFGDYDGDGDLDILISGVNASWNRFAKIYKNSEGNFSEDTSINLTGVYKSTVSFGDYDNDGDLDILLTGWDGNQIIAKIYKNTNASFSEDTGVNIDGIIDGDAEFGDYDNDGDLDILITGNANIGYISKIYRNNIETANTPPTMPTSLSATSITSTVTLSWSAASDSETVTSSLLTYNLRIGSTPDGMEILSPMALPLSSGYRLIPARGNIQTLSCTIKDLADDTYYWSVQAIDTSFAGSEFYTESSFVIDNVAPIIGSISNQSTLENTAISSITVTATDAGSTACGMSLTFTSSNLTLVPIDHISYSCEADQYTIEITPETNESGLSTISVIISDTVGLTAITAFNLTVTEVNDPPTMSSISDQTLVEFIETFATTDYANITATTANWSTSDEFLKFPIAQRKYNAFSANTVGTTISTYTGNTNDVITGDVNGDGYVDLIIATSMANTNRLFINNGTTYPYSGVTAQNISSDTYETSDLALGDIDSDGDIDLIAGNYGQTNRIYLNNGTSQPFTGVSGADFGTYTYNTESITLVDIDNDEDLDLIEGNENQQNILYLNNGTANPFDGVTPITISNDSDLTQDIVVEDIDNDGDSDVIVANESTFNKLYLNNGSAQPFNGVSALDITTDNQDTESIQVKDMNNDGYLDVICGNTNQVNRLYLNNQTADPFNGVSGMDISSLANATKAIDIHDIDNDGDFDIIEGNAFQANYLYLNNGTSAPFDSITSITLSADTHNTRALIIDDMDSDGDFDFVAGNGSGESNYLYINQSTSNPFQGVTGVAITDTASTFIDLIVSDINGDTYPDVIASNYETPNVLYIHNGTADPFNGVTGTYISSDIYNCRRIAVGDINDDGFIDLVVGNKNQEDKYYLNNGTANPFTMTTGTSLSSETYDTRVIAVADLNNDGHNDVVTGNYNEYNRLYFNNGNPDDPFLYASIVSITHEQEATRALALEDIDNDGDIDVIVGNLGGVNRLHLNSGTDTPFHGETSLTITSDTDNTAALAVGDVDNDGHIDVIAGNYNQLNKLYLNNSLHDPFDGVTGQTIGNSGLNTVSLKLIDIDADGDLDLLEGNESQNNKLYLNNGTATPFAGVVGINIDANIDNTIDLDTGDLDNDGDPDLVVLNENEVNKYYLTDGDNTAITQSVYDLANNYATSIKLRPTGTSQAIISASYEILTQTSVDFYLSTDNSLFYHVQPDQLFSFPETGNGLYWSAYLNTSSPALSPEIYHIIVSSATSPINYTMSDEQGGSMSIVCESSDQSLVDNLGISIAGTGENDVNMALSAGETKNISITVVGLPGQYGTATLTVTITDPEGLTVVETFDVSSNDPPMIDPIESLTIDENTSQFQIPLEITNSVGSLSTVSAFSDNQTLIPNGNLTVDSVNGNYTLNVQTNPNEIGESTITLLVSDSLGSSKTKNFTITVTPINKNPVASEIADQNEPEDTIISVPFAITDINGGVLIVSSETDNLSLFSNYNLLVCDLYSERTQQIVTTSAGNAVWLTFTMVPEADQFGTAEITLTVTDASGLTSVQSLSVTITSVDDAPQISLFQNIAAGDKHTLALNADGTVWAWGANNYGQLGDGTTTNRSTPEKITSLSDVIEVCAGESFSMALKNDGTLWSWGWNEYGMMGIGNTDDQSLPVQVKGQSGAGYLTNVVSVACGEHHILAVKGNGSVWSWGCNGSAKLGDNTYSSRTTPVQIVGEGGSGYLSNIVAAAGGASHSLALDANGNVWAWGSNHYGQVGIGRTDDNKPSPFRVENLSHVKAIASGDRHCIALKTNGTIWVWGDYARGQLGDGLWVTKYIPTRLQSMTDVQSIAAGGNATVLLKTNGKAYAFGQNTYGQIGNNTNTDQRTPVQLSNASDIRSVSAGYHHILVLRKEGDVWACGLNSSGQLGDGTETNQNTAVQVHGLYDVDYLNLFRVNKDTHVKGIKYIISDADGGMLTMTGVSYNTSVFPENTMDIGDSGSNPYSFVSLPGIRYVKPIDLTPGIGKIGTGTFISGISDSTGLTAMSIVKLSVNDVPQMSNIANHGIKMNATGESISFTVGDQGTSIADLVVVVESAYTTLIPNSNIVVSGTASSRSLNITPASEETGTSYITLTISDGNASFSRSFTLTVKTPPEISDILSQETLENLSLNIVFSITDTINGVLSLTGVSSDLLLVNSEGLQLTHPLLSSNNGYSLTVSQSIPESVTLVITPIDDEFGTSEIQVTLTDAFGLTATDSFMLTVIDSISRSIELDGIDDHVVSQETFTLEPTDALTIEAWIYLYTNTGDLAIMTYGNTINESITFEHRNHNLDLRLRNNSNTDLLSLRDTSAPGFSLGEWHHVCASWDNTSNNGYLYKNGTLLYSDTFSSDTIGYSGTRQLFIGSWFGLGKWFNGKIDDIRIWKTALTRNIINTWKFTHLTIDHPYFDQLVAYYPLNAVSGNKIYDIHKSHHGLLYGPQRSLYIPFDNWLNTGNNKWNTPSNWESTLVPIDKNPGFTIINAGIRVPELTAPATVHNLVLTKGGTYRASEANPLTITGKMYNHFQNTTIDIGDSITVMGSCDFKTDKVSPVSDAYAITATASGDDVHLIWRKATDNDTTDLLYAVVMSAYSSTCVESLSNIAENLSPCNVQTVIPFQTVSGSGSGETIRSAGGNDAEVDVLSVGSGNYFNVLVRDEMFNLREYLWAN